MSAPYDRHAAQRALAAFRSRRRSASPDTVESVCRALGYEIDTKRGKGSHRLAKQAGAPAITIPTGNKVLGVRTATSIVTTLEEVFESDGTGNHRQRSG